MWLLLALLSPAMALSTGALDLTLDGATLAALSAAGGPAWVEAAAPLYDLGRASLSPSLEAEALPDGQVLLRLTLVNRGATAVQTDVRFPILEGLGTGSAAPLGYFFPALGTILGDSVATHERHYGALFPLQFMEIHQGGAGLWLMTRDLEARAKTFRAGKGADNRGRLEVAWPGLVVEAGGAVQLEASLGVHDSDWHEALRAYRRWATSWYQPRAAPKATFREAFNLRQVHLHQNPVLGDHPGAFDAESGVLDIVSAVEADAERLGGVDWVHLFDWGTDQIHGRVGDYNPWSYLGPPAVLRAEVDALQAQGIGVGLYVEGYLLDTTSLVGLAHGATWAMETAGGGVYTNYAPSWHVCPAVEDWRAHFALRNGRRTELRAGASGLYVDQHGYGYQYPCYREDHDHGVPSAQLQAERALMAELRAAMSPEQVLYTEAAPIDATSPWQDGAFTEAVRSFRDDSRAVPVHLRRFALPLLKTFELLTQDAPLGEDLEGVRLAFFSGEGIRHMGYFEDDPWFGEATLAEIAHAWSVLRRHRAAFTGSAPEPLVETVVPEVYANLFAADGGEERVWTLYNGGSSDVSGEVLRIDAVQGASWRDCWRDQPLSPPLEEGFARISLSIPASGVGCVAESRPAPAATLLAHWPLDEAPGATAAEDVVGGLDGEAEGGSGGPWPGATAADARLGSAWTFDGAGALRLGSGGALAGLAGEMSLAAWVRPDTEEGVLRILAAEGWEDGGFVFGLTHTGDRRALFLTTVGVQDYVLPVVIPEGRWTHMAVVLDSGASAHFYVDGELRGSVAHHEPGEAGRGASWWIGSNGIDGAWSGDLDDLRVYAGSLAPPEIRALADVSPPLPGWIRAAEVPWTEPDHLELWWPGFYDPGSGIVGYQVALGSTPGGEDLLPSTAAGTAQQGTLEGLSLPDGVVHVTVRAEDGAGLRTEVRGTVEVQASTPPLLASWLPEETPPGTPVDPALVRTERFTVAAWIWPEAEGYQAILGSDEGGWTFGLGGDGDDLVLVTGGREEFVVAAAVPLERWSHAAVSLDAYSDARFYLDGEEVGVVHGTLPAAESASGFAVGGEDWPWQGRLGEVRLYDGVLRPGEVAALYRADSFDTGGGEETGVPADTAEPGGGDSGPVPPAGCGTCGFASRGSAAATGSLWLLAVALCRRRPGGRSGAR